MAPAADVGATAIPGSFESFASASGWAVLAEDVLLLGTLWIRVAISCVGAAEVETGRGRNGVVKGVDIRGRIVAENRCDLKKGEYVGTH